MIDTVYKYTYWDDKSEISNIIKTKTIKLNNPSAWDADYEEWTLPFDWDSITRDQINRIVAERATKELLAEEKLNEITLQNRIRELESKLMFYDKKNRQKIEEEEIEKLKKYVGAFCTSTTIDSLKMWEGWGLQGAGYVVSFNVKELLKNPKMNGLNKEVNYYPPEKLPKISPLEPNDLQGIIEEFELQLFSIPEKNKIEREYRFTKINIKEGKLTPYTKEDRLVKLSNECYKSIILGYRMPIKHEKELLESISQNLKDIPIYKAEIEDKKVVLKEYKT